MSALRTDPFQREKHVYKNDDFSEIIKDAVRFFHGTPVHTMPPPEPFDGAGVYAIYCIARQGLYRKFGETINREEYAVPIYVGKAVPPGWRQSRDTSRDDIGRVLYHRLNDHMESISKARNLSLDDFTCRFVIFEGPSRDMIAAVEAALIQKHNPLWNSVIDGFGNHDPGIRRIGGRVPQWDVLHPGREWAERMTGERPILAELKRRIVDYMAGLRI